MKKTVCRWPTCLEEAYRGRILCDVCREAFEFQIDFALMLARHTDHPNEQIKREVLASSFSPFSKKETKP